MKVVNKVFTNYQKKTYFPWERIQCQYRVRVAGEFEYGREQLLVEFLVGDLMTGALADHVEHDRLQEFAGSDLRLPVGTVQSEIDDARKECIWKEILVCEKGLCV